ncbi:MAG: hypothetical protein R6V73_02465 [Anaerolineales bacterium]|jgi:hypothetical protein
MFSLNSPEVQLSMGIGLFVIGVFTFWIGVIILVSRTTGRDVRTIASQTTRLAQKGLAEEIAGLVGNASTLLNALNDLVRTAAGIGIFLTIIGLLLMGTSIWLVLQIP